MASVIMVYSTTDGHTRKICERLRDVIEQEEHAVTIVELTPDSDIDLTPYDRVVIGASIRYGKHRPEVAEFAERNVTTLQSKPSAFFSVNAVARKPEFTQASYMNGAGKFGRGVEIRPDHRNAAARTCSNRARFGRGLYFIPAKCGWRPARYHLTYC